MFQSSSGHPHGIQTNSRAGSTGHLTQGTLLYNVIIKTESLFCCLLILYGIRRNCMRSGKNRSLYLYVRRAIKQTVVITAAYHFCNLLTKFLSNILLSTLTPFAEEIIGDHQCVFRCNWSTTDHIFCIRQILEKNRNMMKQCISYW